MTSADNQRHQVKPEVYSPEADEFCFVHGLECPAAPQPMLINHINRSHWSQQRWIESEDGFMETQLHYWKIQLKSSDILRRTPCQQRTTLCVREDGIQVGGGTAWGTLVRGSHSGEMKPNMRHFLMIVRQKHQNYRGKTEPKSFSHYFQNGRIDVSRTLASRGTWARGARRKEPELAARHSWYQIPAPPLTTYYLVRLLILFKFLFSHPWHGANNAFFVRFSKKAEHQISSKVTDVSMILNESSPSFAGPEWVSEYKLYS